MHPEAMTPRGYAQCPVFPLRALVKGIPGLHLSLASLQDRMPQAGALPILAAHSVLQTCPEGMQWAGGFLSAKPGHPEEVGGAVSGMAAAVARQESTLTSAIGPSPSSWQSRADASRQGLTHPIAQAAQQRQLLGPRAILASPAQDWAGSSCGCRTGCGGVPAACRLLGGRSPCQDPPSPGSGWRSRLVSCSWLSRCPVSLWVVRGGCRDLGVLQEGELPGGATCQAGPRLHTQRQPRAWPTVRGRIGDREDEDTCLCPQPELPVCALPERTEAWPLDPGRGKSRHWGELACVGQNSRAGASGKQL